VSQWVCEELDGWTFDTTDCDDYDSSVYPGAPEICDDLDNDCDGLTEAYDPDAEIGVYYRDADGDGEGDASFPVTTCDPPSDYVTSSDDCDDSDPGMGAPTAWFIDADHDGYGDSFVMTGCWGYYGVTEVTGDCDDSNPETFPGAEDYCGDGIDSDCGGESSDWAACTDLEPQDVLSMVSCTDAPGALEVSGDHISINYGADGFWYDTATGSGLKILPTDRSSSGSSWAEVVTPGTQIDMMTLSLGSLHYVGGYSVVASNFTLTCATEVSMGDVIGAVHEFEVATAPESPWGISVYITRTELWNESGETMLVHYSTSHTWWDSLDVKVQRFIDPDIDYDAHGVTETVFEHAVGSPYTAASGPTSDWTVGWGSCSSYGKSAGFNSLGMVAVDDDLCDPDEVTDDIMMGFSWMDSVSSGGSTNEFAFVMSIGNSAATAEDNWSDDGEDFCGDLWNHWMSPVFSECSSGGSGGGHEEDISEGTE
jgi:hypothetical protein